MMLNLNDSMRIEVAEEISPATRIKVLGIGGGGGNAVARMMEAGLSGVEFYVLNTDRQALANSPVPNKLAIGAKVTNGLGAGADPSVGRQAALEDTERIIEVLEGADMVFITACLGGGTGTGAAPIVASLAKELNALTVSVVTTPFRFEGPRRRKLAEHGLAELAGTVDTVITIPNTRLLEVAPASTGFLEAFRIADDVLRQAVQGISDIIITPGVINRDFADIRALMLGMGYAMMSTATAKGEKAIVTAARTAIENPLLEDGGIKGARGTLINITAASHLPIQDIDEACTLIWQATENEDVHSHWGMVLDDNQKDEVKVTVIATGFQREGAEAPRKVEVPMPHRMASQAASQTEPPAARAARPMASVIEPHPVEFVAQPVMPAAPDPDAIIPEVITDPLEGELEEPVGVAHDLETPAFLRRERRLFQ
jgi:cell division protein FtsZ